MTTAEIDEAILSVVDPGWLKVAMIVGDACKQLGLDQNRNNRNSDLVLERIHALVSDGRLVAQGDVSRPRYSEVRVP